MPPRIWLPATWILSEVDGSFALQLGVQAGYDFSWLREIPGGALQGDIGLRVQMGASAAFGFEVSGKYPSSSVANPWSPGCVCGCTS